MRHNKVMQVRESIPTPEVYGASEGDVLVLGWGSTYGSIASAVGEAKKQGKAGVGGLHLRHVWPLPNGLDEIFGRFKAILIPEMNLGQLARILRSEYPHQNFVSFPKVQGQPFRTDELLTKIDSILES